MELPVPSAPGQTLAGPPCEPVAERFSGQQELEQKAKAAAVRRAGVQAVEACSTGEAATIQTGTACEDRDAKAEGWKPVAIEYLNQRRRLK